MLTSRERAAVAHFTLLATSFLAAAESYDMREDHAELALANRSKAGGLIIAIAFIRGETPSEVQTEIEQSLESDDGLRLV